MRLLLLTGAGLLAFTAVTLLALEGREVVIVRSRDASGRGRETRTWIADHDGYAWIESANPERPFFLDILADPDIEIVRAGEVIAVHAVPLPPEEGHPLIRRLLREKHGLADWWIGLLADTSRSTAIRLEPRVRQ